MGEFLSTHEVADYLRIRERKVYELLRLQRIPASRVAGKWLFPRALIDLWVLRGVEGGGQLPVPSPPAVVGGSHDPLLEWAVRESGSELALMLDGSLDGLARLAAGKVLACGIHVRGEDGSYNTAAVAALALPAPVVVLEWAWREQGLVVARGNPLRLEGLADLPRTGARFVGRQSGAGARLLLDALLAENGIDAGALELLPAPARSESEVAMSVLSGAADAGLGIRANLGAAGLEFVPLTRERYDLVIGRRDFFEPPFQRLLTFTRTPRFTERASAFGGYDTHGTGTVHWNSPAA